MKLSCAELEQLQKTELGILSDFDAYCQENGMRYYLIGGALLGAARYQGMIPWDDDIDVAMPREDYERLKLEFHSDKYFLQNAESDPLFARCIQKIRLNGTRIIEFATQDILIHQGIYIDIFPIDYLDTNDARIVAPLHKRICRLMSLRTIKSGYKTSRYVLIKRLIALLCPLSARKIDKRIERLCTVNNRKNRKYAILWLHNYNWDKQIHPIQVFGAGSVCQLGKHQYMAPADMHSFLARVFGEDYMKEPPAEKQRNPHQYLGVTFPKEQQNDSTI